MAEKFDGFRPVGLRVPEDEIRASAALVPDELKEAIKTAQANITRFPHRSVT
jgi:histidinol dehydrogenase